MLLMLRKKRDGMGWDGMGWNEVNYCVDSFKHISIYLALLFEEDSRHY